MASGSPTGYPRLLADQLLAAVRVAHETPVSLMFPMVAALDELVVARRALDAAIAADGRGTPSGLQVGIMVEVPATALKAAAFVPHVDFFSIGTNDLTQYALAAERGNPAVAALADPLDPGVLRLVDAVCRAAGERALVAVCGEAAADPLAAALLVGLGVRELSVGPARRAGHQAGRTGARRGRRRPSGRRCPDRRRPRRCPPGPLIGACARSRRTLGLPPLACRRRISRQCYTVDHVFTGNYHVWPGRPKRMIP